MTPPDAPKTCFDDYDPNSLLMEQALERIAKAMAPVTSHERVDIRSALDRVLAQDVISTLNVPSHTNSAMDGYAIAGSDIPSSGERVLTLAGTVMAGAPLQQRVSPGQCARIMTGGKMPDGTDTVIMQEHVQVENGQIRIQAGHRPGQNVRQAGEDLAIGEHVFSKGKLLTPADIGMLASLGIPEVDVYRRIRVAFFSTGDELVAIDQPLGDGQIHDSNRYTLHCMLTRFGADIIDMGVIPDDRYAIEQAFESATTKADVLITTGGVSVGEADFVKETLEKVGNVNFWKIAMKPGRPLAFGHVNQCRFFGLPGNPVSAMVTFYQFVLPALKTLSGQTPATPLLLQLPCMSTLKKSPGRVEFQRGLMQRDEQGNLVVVSTGEQGSGMLSSMSKANCFIVLPLDSGKVEPGTLVDVQPFCDLM